MQPQGVHPVALILEGPFVDPGTERQERYAVHLDGRRRSFWLVQENIPDGRHALRVEGIEIDFRSDFPYENRWMACMVALEIIEKAPASRLRESDDSATVVRVPGDLSERMDPVLHLHPWVDWNQAIHKAHDAEVSRLEAESRQLHVLDTLVIRSCLSAFRNSFWKGATGHLCESLPRVFLI